MELINYLLRILRKYWISVVAVTLGGILAGGLVSILTTPVYSASASVMFTIPSAATPAELSLGATYMTAQVKSYVELARTPLVIDPVIKRLDLRDSAAALAGRITSTNPAGTAIVAVAVTGTDAAQVAAIATEVARELMIAVDGLAPQGSTGIKAIKATLVSPASVPSTPTSPLVIQNLAMGAMLGLLLAVGQAALRDYIGRGTASSPNVEPQVTERSRAGLFPPADRAAKDVGDAYDQETYRESLEALQRSVDAILARLG